MVRAPLARIRSVGLRGVAAVPQACAWLGALPLEGALVLSLVAVALVAHGLNMFHYPAFTFLDDEGIYAQQAWAIIRQGRLSPYTYFYDHAPGGWILIAAWMQLTGGPNAFGGAIDSGRVLVLLLHLAMVPLLYRLARRLHCSVPFAALAVLLFAISPLAVFYQRLLLLDNIMVFWVFVSLELLLDGRGRLSRTFMSGLCFGLAILSKETGLFLTPAMLFIAIQQRWKHHGRFAVSGWLLPAVIAVSWYPLYALLKGELLPVGRAIGLMLFNVQSESHVSLIESLQWQASRGGGGMFNLDNQFWYLMRTDWLPRDAILMLGGCAAVLANLGRGIRSRHALAAGLLGALPLFYLARGGIVQSFYILFAIPFLCLNLAALASQLTSRLPRAPRNLAAPVAAVALLPLYWNNGFTAPLYREQPDRAGRTAIGWIKQHLPPESRIITRDDLLTDLREDGFMGPAFPDAHSHYKVAADPEIRGGVFWDDWRRVDYVIVAPGLGDYFAELNNVVAMDAMANSREIKRWSAGDTELSLWKVDRPGSTEAALLRDSAAFIKHRFERNGAYVAPNGSVFSESQAYAMLRAVWSDDRESFQRTWVWTKTHLMSSDGLLAWLWRDGAVVDSHSASDADVDAALALLFAGKQWADPELIDEGQRMVRAIWQHDVATAAGSPYLSAGNWAADADVVVINPSYLSPHAFHIFQEVDGDNPWLELVDSSYRVLFAASEAAAGGGPSVGLPPDWIGLDRASGRLVPVSLGKGNESAYGHDAARTYWRAALHERWTRDGRATAYLRLATFLGGEAKAKGFVSAVYGPDGSVVEPWPSMVGLSGAVSALLTADPPTAHAVYASNLVGAAWRRADGAGWGDPEDLYAQAWGWFGTALYADALTDVWHSPCGTHPC